VNEYFGKAGVRRLTLLTAAMIGYSFVVLYLAIGVPAWEQSPVPDHAFRTVFGQSQWIIVGSLAAFLVSQLVDVLVFVAFKSRTGHRMLWLRATGSTLVSQLVDTFVVGSIAFVIPGKLTLSAWLPVAAGSYLFKVGVAVVITPLIYIGHGVIDRFLAADVRSAEPDIPA
jgi:queuosine precursor transporter